MLQAFLLEVAVMGSLAKAEASLRKLALSYPETVEDHPWGHSAFKVKGKSFLFTYLDENEEMLSLSMKLPVSNAMALTLPFAKPTEYGLGKSGWVTSKFGAKDDIPLDMLKEWIDESFRAIAPKKLLASLEIRETKAKPRRGKK